LNELSWLADLGTAGIVLIAVIIMLKWSRDQQKDQNEAMKVMARAVDKNSVSVVTLGQAVVSLVTALSQRQCLVPDLQTKVTELIQQLEEAQRHIERQGNGGP